MFRTLQVVLRPSVLPTEAPLAVQGEMVLDLFPELLVDQRLVPAVLSGPGGDSLPTQRTAQSGFVHRLQETALQQQQASQSAARLQTDRAGLGAGSVCVLPCRRCVCRAE